MEERNYLVYLHSLGISQRKLTSIFANKQNYEEVFREISFQSLQKLGFSENQTGKILDRKKHLNTEFIDKKLLSEGVSIVTISDTQYPNLLKEISNPPYVLYIKGNIHHNPCISVIGSRKISSYGARVISKIVPDLCSHFTIVSGGAYGCDSEAHQVALDSAGITYVIIGTGIDIVYPMSNKKLYDSIVLNGGAIISIFPIGEPGNPHNFPIRNEVISGISLGTLVVEAGERSGTLITAKLALEQGRDVFVVPGEADRSNSLGCNLLLKNGEAKFTTSGEDIVEEYNFLKYSQNSKKQELIDPVHIEVYELLSHESLSVDEISFKMNYGITQILPHISLLEMRKIVKKNQEGKYELC